MRRMGEKTVEFQTSLSVRECGLRLKTGIEGGRGTNAWIGGMHATKLLQVAQSAVAA
jgi:hypothetical protein